VMDKHIGAILRRDESITFLIIEPLDFTFCHYGESPSLCCAPSGTKRPRGERHF
jgi:hypothetical protein